MDDNEEDEKCDEDEPPVTLTTHLIDTLVHMDIVSLDDTEKEQEENNEDTDFLWFTPSIVCQPAILYDGFFVNFDLVVD